jgi:hypothetical protein
MAQQSAETETTFDQDLCVVAARRIKSIKLGRVAVDESDISALALVGDLQATAQRAGDDELDVAVFSSLGKVLEEAGQDLAIAIIPSGTNETELRQLRCARLVNQISPISCRSDEGGYSLVASLMKIWGDA